MNNITKKIVAIITTVTCAVWLVGPGMAQATTAAELQTMIDSLLAQIATLQSQLTTLQGGTSTAAPAACSGITFSRNLKLGMSGTDVKCLQAILNQNSTTQVAASGVGSSGNETTYFGALTKAGVVKFQELYAADCLTPLGLTQGTGFVGAKTIAKLNGILAGTIPTTPETTLPTAAGLTVALAADNPASTQIISDGTTANVAGSQALIPFVKLNFATPVGTTAKVTTLKLKRTGISTDTDIPNVYLYDGDTKLAEMTSMSLGVVTFTNAAGLFTVSGTKTVTVKADLYKDATAGKTIGFGVAAATDITTDASAVNGTFPINGNAMTVAVVDDFGRLTVATSTNSSTVDPGTSAFEVMRITLAASNQKVAVYSIKFLQLGSIAKTDISNLSLWVGATQIGSTVASLATDGSVTFALSTPYEIASGVTRTVSLKADVVGGSTRTIQFSLQKSSDIVVMDANYGVYLAPDTTAVATWSVLNSTAALVAYGNLTISKSTDSPSGNVALNSTNITLAKFSAKAVGEDIKVSSLVIKVATSGTATTTVIKNVRVIYDGYQVGNTQTSLSIGVSTTLSMSFTVPVGQTKIIEIKADIQGTGLVNASELTASLQIGTTNAQRMTSLGTFNFPAAIQSGNKLTVSTAALSASKNVTIGDITTVYGAQSVIIGSWLITAGSAEGVDVSKIGFKDAVSNAAVTAGSYSLGAAFTNLEAYYGSTQLGSTVVPNTTDATGTEYSFYPSPALSLAAGQTIRVDLKANVLSVPTWTTANAVQISTVESTGKVTTNAANVATAKAGQGLTLSGAGVLTGALDSSSPQTGIVAMASTGQVMGIWKLSANSTEDLTVSQIILVNRTSATSSANANNLTLYCGSDAFGTSVSGLILSAAGTYYAGFGGTCVVPKGSNKLITLKADVTSYANGAQTGAYLEFSLFVPLAITGLATDEIIARGSGDYASTTARSTSTANRVYPYRTSLTSALTISGSATGRVRSATDKVASLTLTGTANADALFSAALNGDDEAITNWAKSQVSGGLGSVSAVSASGTKIEGTYSIQYQASGTDATTTWAAVYLGGSDLSGYTKVSLWLYSATTTARTIFITNTTSSTAFTKAATTTTSGALFPSRWNYFEWTIPSLNAASSTYIGVALESQDASTVVTTLIDAIKAYNDSITVNVAGSLATGTATGTAFYLKTTGGTERAVGYYDGGTAKVVLVPSTEIAIGSSAVPLDLITDTTLLMAVDTTANETLSLSSNLGTYTTAGDFRWYDQAVAATSPITWMNGASPISVSLSY